MLFWNEKRKYKLVCDYCLKEYDTIGDPRKPENECHIETAVVRPENRPISLLQVCCISTPFMITISSVHVIKWYVKKHQLLDEGWKLVFHELSPYLFVNFYRSTIRI